MGPESPKGSSSGAEGSSAPGTTAQGEDGLFRLPPHGGKCRLQLFNWKIKGWKTLLVQAGGEAPTCYDLFAVALGDVPLQKECVSQASVICFACGRRKTGKHLERIKNFGAKRDQN